MVDNIVYGVDYDFKKVVEYITEDKHQDVFDNRTNAYDNFEKIKHEALNACNNINSWDDLINFLELCRVKPRRYYSIEYSRLCDLYVIVHSVNKLREIDEDQKSENFVCVMKILETDAYDDFITCPASSKYHGSYNGGLFDHSIGVYEAALKCAEIYGLKKENISLIACLFHDLCKVGRYNEIKGGGYAYNNDKKSIAHGSESLLRIVELGIYLQPSWKLAVNYHMGAFNDSKEEVSNFSRITETCPEVLLLHHADMIATKIYQV